MQNNKKYQQMTMDLKPIKMEFDGDAKSKFNDHRTAGDFVQCPCCNKKYNIIYKRPLYLALVKGLRNLNRKDNVTSSIGDFAKLRFWGFIIEGAKKGHWMITPTGRDFLTGDIRAPKYMLVQNNIKIGQSDETISVFDIHE